MQTRLGLEIGESSIGWCLFELDVHANPVSIRDLGVRVFRDGRDPRSRLPLAVGRRIARSMRRRRDRYVQRRSALLAALADSGLMPVDEQQKKALALRDPYELRAAALDRPIALHDFGRILFHLGQRRGFKFNRKVARAAGDKEDGTIASGIKALDEAMAQCSARTYGEFLFLRASSAPNQNAVPCLRVRRDPSDGRYAFFPERRHLEDEFDRLWAAQAAFHPDVLHAKARARLRRIVFFQRPLQSIKEGMCTVFREEPRMALAHPAIRERFLLEAVNQLQIVRTGHGERALSIEQRDILFHKLRTVKLASLGLLARLIGLASDQRLAVPGSNATSIAGDVVSAAFSAKRCFGPRWARLDKATQWSIIEKVADEEDSERLVTWLVAHHGVTDEEADAIAQIALPEGYDRLGSTANRLLLHEMRRAVVSSRQAYKVAFGDLRLGDKRPGGHALLPYYGEILASEIVPGTLDSRDEGEQRWGRVNHPGLHIAFNQLRRVMNAIITKHGKPDEVVVALARDLKASEKVKSYAAVRRRSYMRAAQDGSVRLREASQPDTGYNRAVLKLWDELDVDAQGPRGCPFCGEPIAQEALFGNDVAITHILPFSRSFDDGWPNRTVAHRACIHAKGNQTPWEAWGHTARWPAIMRCVERLDRSRQWRFSPKALGVGRDGAAVAIAKQLTDRHFYTGLAQRYLDSLYDDVGAVTVTPGRLTPLLRRLWGLDTILPDHARAGSLRGDLPERVWSKGSWSGSNWQTDLRHPAINAAVAGLMAPRFLDEICESIAFNETRGEGGIFGDVPDPWAGFRDDIAAQLGSVIVSHKPDHGRMHPPPRTRDSTGGRLHNDTAYGLTGTVGDNGLPVVVHRISVTALKPGDLVDAQRIAGADLRRALQAALAGLSGKAFEEGLAAFARHDPVFAGIRRVRVRQPMSVIAVRDAEGNPYKAFKGDANARFEAWELPDGKWVGQVISMFDDHQRGFVAPRPHPAARKVLALRQNDLIAIVEPDDPKATLRIMRVLSFGSGGQVRLAGHNEGGALRERALLPPELDPLKLIAITANGLKKRQARQVRVDELGGLHDPGPR